MTDFQGTVLFCDDVRDEVSGKQLLIGVYNGEMHVAKLPAEFGLCIWARIEGLKIGEHTFKATLTYPNSVENIASSIVVDNDESPVIMIFPPVPLKFEADGQIIFEMSFDGGEKVKLGSLRFSARSRQ